ncbi:hypothetical protein EV426DRAFT_610770 [Tirmania nivea]|nr:hypothetical protein EV426DRAFT_610770 [Tirmania nivea]
MLLFPWRNKSQSRSPILLLLWLWLSPWRDEAERRRCTAHGVFLFALFKLNLHSYLICRQWDSGVGPNSGSLLG